MTSDNKAPKTAVEFELNYAGFFVKVKCSLTTIIDKLNGVLKDLSGERISDKLKKLIVAKVNEAFVKFQAALQAMVSHGLDSFSTGYTSEKIPLLNWILDFTVTFSASNT